MDWTSFNNSTSIGSTGSEEGVILRGEEHELGARITLEKDCTIAPFSITCGVYGWMFHTRFFSTEEEVNTAYTAMRLELGNIIEAVPMANDPELERKTNRTIHAIDEFVRRFP